MVLFYKEYRIEGTPEEITEFLQLNEPITVSNNISWLGQGDGISKWRTDENIKLREMLMQHSKEIEEEN